MLIRAAPFGLSNDAHALLGRIQKTPKPQASACAMREVLKRTCGAPWLSLADARRHLTDYAQGEDSCL